MATEKELEYWGDQPPLQEVYAGNARLAELKDRHDELLQCRQMLSEMTQRVRELERGLQDLAEYASHAAIVDDVEYPASKMERVTELVNKYLEAK